MPTSPPSWYDETDLLRAGHRLSLQRPDRVREFGTVVLYLPQALTQAESGVRPDRWPPSARCAPSSASPANAKADATVLRSLERIGVEAPPSPARPRATRVLTASDADDEVRCVVREVVAALRTTPAHRVAVLYAAQNPYARLLHEHLAAAGIAVNGPGTRPVHERAVARAVLELLDLGRARHAPRATCSGCWRPRPCAPTATGSPSRGGSGSPAQPGW